MFGSQADTSWRQRFRSLLGRAPAETFSEEELETLLFEADLSSQWVDRLLTAVRKKRSKNRADILDLLIAEVVQPYPTFRLVEERLDPPSAILLMGVNGSGKTTVAAKLAQRLKREGKSVVLAAGDTFRAGAVDQLKIWAQRLEVDVVAQAPGADPAAVVFDGWKKALAVNAVLIADTAGRLHTKKPLIAELKKMIRVLGRDGRGAPHVSYLVLDAITGQNAIAQSREFLKAAPLTGLVVTKLDGTARGGAALSAALELSLPIRYLGIGEHLDDLIPFQPQQFAQELFRI